MKKLTLVVMMAGLLSAVPVFASDHSGMKMHTNEGIMDCAAQAESIQAKIKRINGEIKKGSKEYSVEELQNLETKLKEANGILDSLMKK